MNWFGKKKPAEPTTVSATSAARPADPQTTIVKLRESISDQEKRYVLISNSLLENMGKGNAFLLLWLQ